VTTGLKELIGQAVTDAEKAAVTNVWCIGGASRLPPIAAVVHEVLPGIEVDHVAPDIIASGAMLDAAQETERLPKELQAAVIGVAPYSIGISGLGSVIMRLIPRGEPLPAIGKLTTVTTVDWQTSLTVGVYQGDHVLVELSDLLGSAQLTDLPLRRREEVSVEVRIEYDTNGILRFSATEEETGHTVTAKFESRTTFTEEDRLRLQADSHGTLKDEIAIGNRRFFLASLRLDLDRAEKQGLTAEVAKWREWIETHENARWREVEEAAHTAQEEFWELRPDEWPDPEDLFPDLRFTPIWPTGPTFTEEGAAIVRFLTVANCRVVLPVIVNVATDERRSECDYCQFPFGDRIETVMRVVFPSDGSYEVFIRAGRDGLLRRAEEAQFGDLPWRFKVTGTPAPRRAVCQLITGRRFAPLVIKSDVLEVEPRASCVVVPSDVYRFVANFRGDDLGINGRKRDGVGQNIIFPLEVDLPEHDGWHSKDLTMIFPSAGVLEILFFVGEAYLALQLVLVGEGSQLEPTNEERIQLAAVIP
jgi:hypothetical protein